MTSPVTQLAECDREIEAQLERLQIYEGSPAKGKKRSRARNDPKFDKHFTSWLALCPGTKITGGKVMSSKAKRCANRALRPCS